VIPIVSRSDQLITSDSLYIKDLPAYDNSEKKNDQLDFCQQQFNRLAKNQKAISLADNIIPVLDIDNSEESEEVNNSWNEYISAEPFKSAVLRLSYHEGKIGDDEINQESIDGILPSVVLLMDSLVVNYFIDDTWIYDDMSTPTYQDTQKSVLYLLNQDDAEDMCESIAKFISDTSRLNRDSFSLISRILRYQLDTFEEIHKLLDKKNIKSLPEKIEIDEDNSLYGNSNVAEVLVEDDEKSHDYSSEEEQDLSKENQASRVNDAQNDSDFIGRTQRKERSGGEIPPPTSPKKSSFSNKKGEDSSFGERNSQNYNADRGRQKSNGTNGSQGTKSHGSSNNKSSSKANRGKAGSNDRLPVYVGKEKDNDSSNQQDQKEHATEIGNRGEAFVLDHSTDYLFSKSNMFEKAPANNKGYDITEVDSNGEIVRYIEVKTLTGRWGEGGVGVTEFQLKFAQEYDNWWLFVVENINTENTTVYRFKNPVQQANRFMFDHSWKQLAETKQKYQSRSPKKGDKYKISGSAYEVTKVKSMGKFYKVRLKDIQTGEKVNKKFDPLWEKF